MNTPKNISIREALKKLKPQDFIYPGVIVVFLCVTIFVFFLATQFISKNINKIFTSEDSGAVQALNLAQYKIVAKKLNIEVIVPQEAVASVPVIATSTPVVAAQGKHGITITVKNSTAKKGAATTLANALEVAGFSKPSTTNESKTYSETMIIIKEDALSSSPAIVDEVKKLYPNAIATTTSNSALFDVTIIIGSR